MRGRHSSHGGGSHASRHHGHAHGRGQLPDCGVIRPRRFHQRLFWRVYLHGAFLVMVVVATAAALSFPFRNPPPFIHLPERLTGYLETEIAAREEPFPVLKAELERLNRIVRISYSIYDANLQVRDSNVSPPLEAAPLAAEAPLEDEPGLARRLVLPHPALSRRQGGWEMRLFLHRRSTSPGSSLSSPLVAQVVMELPGFTPQSYFQALLRLLAVMLALGVTSVPLVRLMVLPLERLTDTTVAFGEGDLSARTGIERADEAGLLARAFDQMADRIQALVRGEKELVANVSHELRTPLARIRVALELAEDDPEEARRYLHEIRTDLNELDGLVEDVLITARLDLARGRVPGGSPPLHLTQLPSEGLLNASAERFRQLWPETPLETAFEGPLPALEADPVLLRRVFDNLLDNARKHGDPASPIRFCARMEAEQLVVSVADRGPGIAEADLPHLFTPFFRTDRSRQRETGGVGLGLALVRRVVEAHGGRVDVTSQLGEGTTFFVWLKHPTQST